MIKPNLTIVDGSSLLYSASYNNSIKKEYTDDFSVYRNSLDFYIDSILTITKADYYIIFGDRATSYRKKLFSNFKGTRKKRPHMKFLYDLKNYANTELGFFSHSELEADDLCLIANNKYKDKYNVTIASKDSDVRQGEGNFFNYQVLGKKSEWNGFETISSEQAQFNLWKQVLIKGHNDKPDYLTGCGDETSKVYLKLWTPSQYKYAVLKAYIEGIERDKSKNINRKVKGYGLNEGINKFNKSFQQTYLFRGFSEIEELGMELEFPKLKTYEKDAEENTEF